MKKLIFALMFIILFSLFAFAQEQNEPCPEISVSSPTIVAFPGDIVVFIGEIKSESKDIKFKWEVKPKYLTFTGQGTSEIRVKSDKNDKEAMITAILKVIGLPKHCNDTASDLYPIVVD